MDDSTSLSRLPSERPRSLAAVVTERIRTAIMNSELKLGEMLSEDKLAAALGVSRTPVREGLTALQLQGLIVTRPQRGSFVFMPSAEDVAELCEFRMVMESRALILCHARAKEATLAAFDRANEAMRNAQGSGQHLASARADADFHDALFVGCGNQYLSQAYSLISGKIGALRANLMQPDVDIRSGSIAEHAEIIDAFRTNDLLRAEAALAGHVFSMRERFAIAQETRQPTSDKRFRVGYKWPGTVESRKY